MSNPWKLTRAERRDTARQLARHVARIKAGDGAGSRPVAKACDALVVECHQHGEVEFGMAIATIATLVRVGGEAARDRLLLAVLNLVADYDPNPEPIPGFDPKQN